MFFDEKKILRMMQRVLIIEGVTQQAMK